MSPSTDPRHVASALHVSIGLLVRRLKQSQVEGELTLPEISALARLDREGPTTLTELAKTEQISPQSMGATLTALEERAFIKRSPDPFDGRKFVVSLTKAGLQATLNGRSARREVLVQALSNGFTAAELQLLLEAAPLLERIAQHI